MNIELGCRCGTVRGVACDVTPRDGNHCVCYCDDCQAFARFLGRDADILDAQGGTEIFQMSSGSLAFTRGLDRLAVIRLTARGPLRWYASCCNTAIGNALAAPGIPFIGLIRDCMRAPDATLRVALGPIRGRVFRRFAKGGPDSVPRGGMPLPLMFARVMGLMLRWRLRGDAPRSPFFDRTTGAPVAEARMLDAAALGRLRAG